MFLQIQRVLRPIFDDNILQLFEPCQGRWSCMGVLVWFWDGSGWLGFSQEWDQGHRCKPRFLCWPPCHFVLYIITWYCMYVMYIVYVWMCLGGYYQSHLPTSRLKLQWNQHGQWGTPGFWAGGWSPSSACMSCSPTSPWATQSDGGSCGSWSSWIMVFSQWIGHRIQWFPDWNCHLGCSIMLNPPFSDTPVCIYWEYQWHVLFQRCTAQSSHHGCFCDRSCATTRFLETIFCMTRRFYVHFPSCLSR